MAESADTTLVSSITYEDLKAQVTLIVTALNSISTAIDRLNATVANTNSKLDTNNTNLTTIDSTLIDKIDAVTGELAKLNTKEVDSGNSDTGSTEDVPSEEEKNAVKTSMESAISSVLDSFITYSYGSGEQDRIMFQESSFFSAGKKGQAIDFSRAFLLDYNSKSIADSEAKEYILLESNNTTTTSASTDSGSMERVKTWKESKTIQSFVVIKNNLSGECRVYFPTINSTSAVEDTTYASEKKAFDAAVSKYQEILDDQHASLAIMSAASINQGILLTEYFEQAKLLTPVYEYN